MGEGNMMMREGKLGRGIDEWKCNDKGWDHEKRVYEDDREEYEQGEYRNKEQDLRIRNIRRGDIGMVEGNMAKENIKMRERKYEY